MLNSLRSKLGRAGIYSFPTKASQKTRIPVKVGKYNSQNAFSSNSLHVQMQERSFRTTSTQNAVHPILVLIISRAAKYGAAIFGRIARSWWKKLPPEEKAIYSGKVRRSRYIIAGLLGASAFGSFTYYDNHLQATPITNRKRFIAFNESQMKEIGKILLEQELQDNEKNILPTSSAKYKRVDNVVQQLLNGNQDLCQIKDTEWKLYLIDDDHQMNAFALPSGSIFVFSGFLEFCDNDDQLGIVLGHEIAHVVLSHGAETLSLIHIVNLLLIIPLAALWTLVPSDIISVIVSWMSGFLRKILTDLPHRRSLEEEADQAGLLLAAKACIEVREAPILWGKQGHDDSGVKWLSTHPSDEERHANLQKMLPDAIGVRDKCKCPPLSPLIYQRMQSEKNETEIDFLVAI